MIGILRKETLGHVRTGKLHIELRFSTVCPLNSLLAWTIWESSEVRMVKSRDFEFVTTNRMLNLEPIVHTCLMVKFNAKSVKEIKTCKYQLEAILTSNLRYSFILLRIRYCYRQELLAYNKLLKESVCLGNYKNFVLWNHFRFRSTKAYLTLQVTSYLSSSRFRPAISPKQGYTCR